MSTIGDVYVINPVTPAAGDKILIERSGADAAILVDDLINPEPVQNNLSASTDPGVNDDDVAGYEPNSVWFNTTASPPEAWRCIDASTGAAVWIKTTLTTDELAAVAISGDSDDLTEGSTNLLLTSAERTILGRSTISQAEAEAGAATTERWFTAERVKQAILALAAKGISFDAINDQTGTTYEFDSGDLTECVIANNASASTYSIPDSLGTAGDTLNLYNKGSGTVTIDMAGTDTLNTVDNDCAQYKAVTILKIASTEWAVIGGS